MPSAWERSVVVDRLGGSFARRAGVLEVADKFTLLDVDADDPQAAFGEPQALGAMCRYCRGGRERNLPRRVVLTLWLTQPIVQVLEDAGDGAGTDLEGLQP